MNPKRIALLVALFFGSGALLNCSDDSPANRANDPIEQTDVRESDATDAVDALDDADTHRDTVHEGTCQSHEDCEGEANQNGFCEPSSGVCVFSCVEHFADCDGDPSNGCEVDLSSDINHCGACDNTCDTTDLNYRPVCSPGEDEIATCSVNSSDCADGYANLNGDFADGCECEIEDPNDPIDADGIDTNCDGVDGVLIDSVFVSASDGDDSRNDGLTPDAPLATLQAALQAASSQGRHHILMAGGTYAGAVSLEDGISIYGGFSPDGFARDLANQTTRLVASPSDFDAETRTFVTVTAQDLARPTLLDHLTIEGFDASNDGASTLALWALSSPGLTLQNTTLTAGIAANGAPGAPGESLDCSPAPAGGDGGQPSGAQPCTSSSNGTAAPGGDYGEGFTSSGPTGQTGQGGAGGTHRCNSNAGDGLPGEVGPPGSPGAPGTPAPSDDLGRFDADGLWIPAVGVDAVDGTAGGGGGGGGAGGNYAGDTLFTCDGIVTSCLYTGGAGGKGGDGGCGGGAAMNGQPGGSSFGLVIVHDPITLTDTTIILGKGGVGGDGGAGQPGQAGEPPMPGQSSAKSNAGNGGRGGYGGAGGHGGNGAGGQGGHAIGLATVNATVDTAGVTFDPSDAQQGAGGAGASPVTNSVAAPDGHPGVIEDTHAFAAAP